MISRNPHFLIQNGEEIQELSCFIVSHMAELLLFMRTYRGRGLVRAGGKRYNKKKASERGMRIFLNPSPCSDNLKNIDFNMLSYIILNEGEAKTLSGCENTENTLSA